MFLSISCYFLPIINTELTKKNSYDFFIILYTLVVIILHISKGTVKTVPHHFDRVRRTVMVKILAFGTIIIIIKAVGINLLQLNMC